MQKEHIERFFIKDPNLALARQLRLEGSTVFLVSEIGEFEDEKAVFTQFILNFGGNQG
jgi:hypothetical protein